jgi:MoxR-like ATPase
MIKLSLGYPGHDAEVEMLKSVGAGRKPEDIEAIVSAQEVGQMIGAVRSVHLADPLYSYIARLCAFTREKLDEVRLGVSPRGAVAMMGMSRAMAASQGRSFVNVDDVRRVAPYVMGHRLLLTPTAELNRVPVTELVDRTIDTVEAPAPVRV